MWMKPGYRTPIIPYPVGGFWLTVSHHGGMAGSIPAHLLKTSR
jgi:hypothetical protein